MFKSTLIDSLYMKDVNVKEEKGHGFFLDIQWQHGYVEHETRGVPLLHRLDKQIKHVIVSCKTRC